MLYRISDDEWPSSEERLIDACPDGCLRNFMCMHDVAPGEYTQCPMGGPKYPLALFLVGMGLAFLYRFVYGCYWKPHRQLKKLEKKMQEQKMEIEMQAQMMGNMQPMMANNAGNYYQNMQYNNN